MCRVSPFFVSVPVKPCCVSVLCAAMQCKCAVCSHAVQVCRVSPFIVINRVKPCSVSVPSPNRCLRPQARQDLLRQPHAQADLAARQGAQAHGVLGGQVRTRGSGAYTGVRCVLEGQVRARESGAYTCVRCVLGCQVRTRRSGAYCDWQEYLGLCLQKSWPYS